MKRRLSIFSTLIPAFCMAILILDSKTAINGAKDGLALCLQTVIPCLLPFFILSSLLTASLTGRPMGLLQPLRKLCGIPKGAESILLLGLLGGYPVGAQSITQAYGCGSLTKQDAHRLLGFCNNAGPSFIFGIVGSILSKRSAIWLLWGIHIISALCVGCALPAGHKSSLCRVAKQPIDLSRAVTRSLNALGNVCGWIILMRVVVAFLDRWFLWLLPEALSAFFIGMLEITNGCHVLTGINTEPVRFITSSVILGSGGICVAMQTVSVTKELGTGMYFQGKLLQGEISLLLSSFLSLFLYNQAITQLWPVLCCSSLLTAATAALIRYTQRKNCSIFEKVCV